MSERVDIAVIGPPGVEVASFLRTISDVTITLGAETPGRSTYVGRITIDDGLVLRLLGSLDGMAEDETSRSLIGAVLLVDPSASSWLQEAQAGLAALDRAAVDAIAVGVKWNGSRADEPLRIRDLMGLPDSVPMVDVVTSDRDSVKEVILSLLYVCLEDSETTRIRAIAR